MGKILEHKNRNNHSHQERELDNKSASTILGLFLKQFSTKKISVGDVSCALADRAFALLMLIFALPNLVPIPLPGISSILGLPLLFLSVQLMVGKSSPWFPVWLSQKSFKRHDMERAISYALPRMKKVENYLKPRLSFLLSTTSEKVIAFICVLMAILIVLPIPLGNWFPALTIFLFSLAILERDGLFVLLGIISAIASLIVIGTIILTSIEAGLFFIDRILS